MISEGSLKKIAQIFCGDVKEFYPYKSGPQLVSFFDDYFDYDEYIWTGFSI